MLLDILAGLEFVFLFQFYRNDIMVSNDCNKVKFLLLFLYKDLYLQGSPLNVWQHLTGLGWVFFCQSSYWMYLHQVSWYHRSFCSYQFGVCRLMEENKLSSSKASPFHFLVCYYYIYAKQKAVESNSKWYLLGSHIWIRNSSCPVDDNGSHIIQMHVTWRTVKRQRDWYDEYLTENSNPWLFICRLLNLA